MGIGPYKAEQRQKFRENCFPDKKTYFKYRDMFELTYELTKHNPRSELSGGAQHLVTTFTDMINQVKVKYCKWQQEEIGITLLAINYIQETRLFEEQFNAFSAGLVNVISKCNKVSNPAEANFTEPEINIALHAAPGLISRVAKPGYAMQHMVCVRNPKNIKYIAEPNDFVVDELVRKNAANIRLVPYKSRTVRSELLALNRGVLQLHDIHKDNAIKFMQEDALSADYVVDRSTVAAIESQRKELTPKQLENYRLAVVDFNEQRWAQPDDIFYISLMYGPSKAVKEKAINTNPYSIGGIRFQYDAIQDQALRVCFDQVKNIEKVYGMLNNPSVQIRNNYSILKSIMDNPLSISRVNQQPEWMQIGALRIAVRQDVSMDDFGRALRNPTAEVTDTLNDFISKQRRGIMHLFQYSI